MAGFNGIFGPTSTAPVKASAPFSGVFGSEGPANVATSRQTLSQVDAGYRDTANYDNSLGGTVVNALKGIGGGIETIGSDMWSSLTQPTPAPINDGFITEKNPTVGGQIITTGLNSYAASLKSAADSMSNFNAVSANPNSTGTQKTTARIGAVLGGVTGFFAPLTAASQAAAQIPVVGHVATWINNIFSAVGTGAADAGSYALQATPFLSQEQKDELDPVVKQASALAGQIATGVGTDALHEAYGGKLGAIAYKLSDAITKANPIKDSEGNTITPNPLVKLPVTGDTTLRPLPVTGESMEHSIPNVNDYRLGPDIPAGPTPKDTSDLPSIQTETPAPNGKLPGYTVEPINNRSVSEANPIDRPDGVVINSDGSKTTTTNGGRVSITETPTPKIENAPITSITNPSSEAPTKVANDISDALVKQGFAGLTPEERSTYTSGSYKDSAAQGEIIKEQDPEALKRMAVTGKNIPAGVHPQILFNIVRKLAADTKDYQLQQELARSPLGTERSNLASGLGSSGYNAVKDSPDDVIREAIKKKAGGDEGAKKVAAEAKKAKSTITKAAAKMMDYKSILDAIKTC